MLITLIVMVSRCSEWNTGNPRCHRLRVFVVVVNFLQGGRIKMMVAIVLVAC